MEGMIVGFMLTDDFITLCHEQRRAMPARFQKGDVVSCGHYLSYSRLVVLEIRGPDLMVSPAASSQVFWVLDSDCELVETCRSSISAMSF
jgi:hypothetical protein